MLKIAYSLMMILLFCPVCQPQTAKVIPLTPDEARTALSFKTEEDQTKEQLRSIQASKAKFDQLIEHKYIAERFPTRASACIVPKGQTECTPPQLPIVDDICDAYPALQGCLQPDKSWVRKDAWKNGFEYSEDYKFIVAKPIYGTSVVSGQCRCVDSTGEITSCPCNVGGMFVDYGINHIEATQQ